MTEPRKLLILVGSPRRAGDSATLANAVRCGTEATGAQVVLRFVDDFISSFLRDCRSCRLPSGECAVADQFRSLFFEDFIPAEVCHLLFGRILVWLIRPNEGVF